MSTPTDTPTRPKRGNGITTPSRRGGSGRMLTDVIVDLGFIDRGTMDLAIERGPRTAPRPSACWCRTGRSATTSSRAPSPSASGSTTSISASTASTRRRQARPARRGAPLPGRAGLLHRRQHADRRHGRSRQRAGDRRHRGHDRLRGPPCGVEPGRRRAAAGASRGPGLRPWRGRARGRGRRRRPRAAAPTPSAPAAPLYDLRENAPINFGAGGEDASVIQLVHRVIKEAVERGASDIHFEPGEEEMRVRYRIDGVLQEAATVPGQRRPGRHLAHQDPVRPRHRRAPDPAGRPHLARGRRQADRPPRRHAPRAVRREGRDANPRPEQGHDPARAAGHAPAGARAVHEGVRAGPRRRARHRPDRLRQVDVALRRAEPAQHDREAHHHDRGPGRVPARRASRRSRSTTRRA